MNIPQHFSAASIPLRLPTDRPGCGKRPPRADWSHQSCTKSIEICHSVTCGYLCWKRRLREIFVVRVLLQIFAFPPGITFDLALIILGTSHSYLNPTLWVGNDHVEGDLFLRNNFWSNLPPCVWIWFSPEISLWTTEPNAWYWIYHSGTDHDLPGMVRQKRCGLNRAAFFLQYPKNVSDKCDGPGFHSPTPIVSKNNVFGFR